MSLLLPAGTRPQAVFRLPSSKSVSNRLLVMQALAGHSFEIQHLSDATDTQILQAALNTGGLLVDIQDCGTAMRFLTAYYALKGRETVLHGTDRMNKRPIGGLVELLKQLGAEIDYLDEPGCPPLHIRSGSPLESFPLRPQQQVSSQFISALLLIGPYMPYGLRIQLPAAQPSEPYIRLTMHWMNKLGAAIQPDKSWINIKKGTYHSGTPVEVDADWSAAVFAYAWMLLSGIDSMELPGLRVNSGQGDEIIKDWFGPWGIHTREIPSGIMLEKRGGSLPASLELDFAPYPDLAPAMTVLMAILGIPCRFSGLESLAVKESDRTAALAKELSACGIKFKPAGKGSWQLEGKASVPGEYTFKTYKDHRLAMAFALFAYQNPVRIDDPDTVRKSFPAYWEQLRPS